MTGWISAKRMTYIDVGNTGAISGSAWFAPIGGCSFRLIHPSTKHSVHHRDTECAGILTEKVALKNAETGFNSSL
jgi:hypothetical protein